MILLPNNSIEFSKLPQIAKANPKLTTFLLGVQEIDLKLKEHIGNVIESKSDDPSKYYCKTEIQDKCYVVNIFNSKRRATIAFSIPMDELLIRCSNKTIFNSIDVMVFKAISLFEKTKDGLAPGKINWIY